MRRILLSYSIINKNSMSGTYIHKKSTRLRKYRKTQILRLYCLSLENGSKIEHYCVKMHYVGKRKASSQTSRQITVEIKQKKKGFTNHIRFDYNQEIDC